MHAMTLLMTIMRDNDDNDDKHCKTLSETSINSNERQSQKNPALYISQDQKRLANK